MEPACGNGNFLAEVLHRKLAVVAQQYRRSPDDYMRYAFVAVSSLYGVDILEDNAEECRERLYGIVEADTKHAIKKPDVLFLESIRYLLHKNILCDNVLTLEDNAGNPITFAEWSLMTGDKVKRRDLLLSEPLEKEPQKKKEEPSLFDTAEPSSTLAFDEAAHAFIPKSIKEYPLPNLPVQGTGASQAGRREANSV